MISCFCNFAVLYSCLKVEERSEKVVGASFLWRSTVGCLLVGHPFAATFSVMLLLKSQYVFDGFSFLKKIKRCFASYKMFKISFIMAPLIYSLYLHCTVRSGF